VVEVASPQSSISLVSGPTNYGPLQPLATTAEWRHANALFSGMSPFIPILFPLSTSAQAAGSSIIAQAQALGPSASAQVAGPFTSAQGAGPFTSGQAAGRSSTSAKEYGTGKGRMMFTRRPLTEKLDDPGKAMASASNPKRRLVFGTRDRWCK